MFSLEKWETAEKRLSILRELIVDGDRVSKICERYSISRMTFYRWLEAYRQAGFEGLVKKSTRPKQEYVSEETLYRNARKASRVAGVA